MNVSAWNSHVPEQVLTDLNVTPVDDMNELIAGSDVVSIHLPLLDSTKGIVTAQNLEALKPGTMFINTARAESSSQARCSPDSSAATFLRRLTCSTMSRSLSTIRCARFQA